MALTSNLAPLIVFVLLLHSLKLIYPAEGSARAGWLASKAAASEFNNIRQYQQMFHEMKRKLNDQAFKRGGGYGDSNKYEDMVRKVPSGPDPLHHNGGSPKKPRTP